LVFFSAKTALAVSTVTFLSGLLGFDGGLEDRADLHLEDLGIGHGEAVAAVA
jgi:hypothetical protein